MKNIVTIHCLVPLFLVSLAAPAQDRISLHQAIERALHANPRVRAAKAEIDRTRGWYWQSISPPPPTVSVNYAFVPKGSPLSQFGERTFEISQAFDFPTTVILHGTQASSETEDAEAAFSAVVSEVTAQVKIAYASVLSRKQKLELAGENLSIVADFARKSRVRRSVGEGTLLEQLTADVQRAQAQNSLETARNDLRIASDELRLLLGSRRDSANGALVLTDSIVFKAANATADELERIAAVSSAGLRTASIRSDIALRGRTLAWSSFLPSFSVSYLRQTRDGVTGLHGASIGVSVPLWFMFDQRGRIQAAEASADAAAHEFELARNSVSVAVRTAYAEMTNDERQVRLYQTDILPQAQEILRAAKASFDAGDISYLEYLQARQTAIQAKASSIDALLAFNISVARLEQIIGRPL